MDEWQRNSLEGCWDLSRQDVRPLNVETLRQLSRQLRERALNEGLQPTFIDYPGTYHYEIANPLWDSNKFNSRTPYSSSYTVGWADEEMASKEIEKIESCLDRIESRMG
jgi:hypothetical protein